jgi:hypothetical protein
VITKLQIVYRGSRFSTAGSFAAGINRSNATLRCLIGYNIILFCLDLREFKVVHMNVCKYDNGCYMRKKFSCYISHMINFFQWG